MGVLGLCYLWVSSFWLFTVVTTASRVLDRGVAGVAGALIAGSLQGAARVRARARIRTMLYLGLAIGSGLSGFALRLDSPAAFRAVIALDAATYVVSGAIYLWVPHVAPIPRHLASRVWRVLHDWRYVAVTVILSVLSLYAGILTYALPLWIVQRTVAPPSISSILFAINAAGYVLLQIVVSRRVETAKAAIRATAIAGTCLCAACVLYAGTSHAALELTVALLVGGLICQLFGGLLASSAQFCLAFALAPDHAQGQYQGFVGTGIALSAAIAPGVSVVLPLGMGPSGWLLLGGVFLLAGFSLRPVMIIAERSRRRTASVGPGVVP